MEVWMLTVYGDNTPDAYWFSEEPRESEVSSGVWVYEGDRIDVEYEYRFRQPQPVKNVRRVGRVKVYVIAQNVCSWAVEAESIEADSDQPGKDS